METTVDSAQFKPLRGLTKPIAQVTLTKSSMTLHWELAPGKNRAFHPNLVLLVFSCADLDKIEEAVRKEGMRSDYPPIVFGTTKEHILVTSPGYINEGLHTPDAEKIIEELKHSLRQTMQIR